MGSVSSQVPELPSDLQQRQQLQSTSTKRSPSELEIMQDQEKQRQMLFAGKNSHGRSLPPRRSAQVIGWQWPKSRILLRSVFSLLLSAPGDVCLR